jgi:hypothetical protein
MQAALLGVLLSLLAGEGKLDEATPYLPGTPGSRIGSGPPGRGVTEQADFVLDHPSRGDL